MTDDNMEPTIDLSDPSRAATEAEAREYLAELRASSPIVWQGAPHHQTAGYWLVTRYSDVVDVCRDRARFVSTRGNVMDTLLNGGDAAGGRMLAVMDGAEHTRLRKLLMPELAPATLMPLAERVAARTRELIHETLAVEVDFASAVAAQIPLFAICELLGVPDSDRVTILRHTSSALSSSEGGERRMSRRLAQIELLQYFAALLTERKLRPANDLVSLMARPSPNGQLLSDEEIVLNCYSLILGGDETTRLALIGITLALATYEDVWRQLLETEPDERFADEAFRWTTPATHVARTVAVDTRIRGVELASGDVIVASLASANFDEHEFDNPLRFDARRHPNKHLAFGYGPHFCIGVHLAHIEMIALLKALRAEARRIEITSEPRVIYSNFLSGYSSLRVAIAAR